MSPLLTSIWSIGRKLPNLRRRQVQDMSLLLLPSHRTRVSHSVSSSTPPVNMHDAAKRESARLKLQGKRPSDNAPPNQLESKRVKSNKEKSDVDDEKEKKIDPIVQNGLYAAEMFAPHIARRHVISFIVNGKSMNSHESLSSNS